MDDGVDRFGHDLADLRLDGPEPAHPEAALDQLADARVVRRNAGGKSGIGGEAAFAHDPPRFLADRTQRRLGILGGKGFPVVEHRFDVGVARDHEIIQFRREEDRRLVARPFVKGKWIGKVEGMKID